MSQPDYVVVRGTAGPSDGKWLDLELLRRDSEVASILGRPKYAAPVDCEAIALTPTGLIEVREDGAVAEVWAPKPWRIDATD